MDGSNNGGMGRVPRKCTQQFSAQSRSRPYRHTYIDDQKYMSRLRESHAKVQSNVKTFLPGWGNSWLNYCAFLGWEVEHDEGDSRDLAGMCLHNSVQWQLKVVFFQPRASLFRHIYTAWNLLSLVDDKLNCASFFLIRGTMRWNLTPNLPGEENSTTYLTNRENPLISIQISIKFSH